MFLYNSVCSTMVGVLAKKKKTCLREYYFLSFSDACLAMRPRRQGKMLRCNEGRFDYLVGFFSLVTNTDDLLYSLSFFFFCMLTSVEQCSYRMGRHSLPFFPIRSGSNPKFIIDVCRISLNACIFSVCVCACCPTGERSRSSLSQSFLVFVFWACGCRPAVTSQSTITAACGCRYPCSHLGMRLWMCVTFSCFLCVCFFLLCPRSSFEKLQLLYI